MVIPIEKVAGLVMDGASSTARRIYGVFALITNNMKNTMDHSLRIFHGLIHQRNVCVKSSKNMNIGAVI
jgi:hypothetical protein